MDAIMQDAFESEVKKINKEIAWMCWKNKVVGANVALFDNEKILYSYNYGCINEDANIKSTNDSLYMIGSNTKVLTALGIFKLIENNMISLDDDIRKYIPEFKINSLFGDVKITVENLLMHRSGIVSDLYNLILDQSRDYHEVIEELGKTYLTSVPGRMFSYSNVGYTLLGIIIERVSGLPYTEYIRKTIAEPLGIKIHFLRTSEEKKPYSSIISLSYGKDGKEMINEPTQTMIPAGSNTYMSMNDFVKVGQIFLNKDNTILKKETLEFMERLNVSEQIDNELQNVGYGLFHNQYDYGESVGKVLGHGGNTTCHHAMFNYIPSLKIGVITLTNSEQATALSRAIGHKALAAYLKAKGYISSELTIEQKHVQDSCDEYLGQYATALGLMDIRKNKKNELATRILKFPVRLIPCEDGYLQCYPDKWLHRLPPIKRRIKGIRLKLINYCGDEVMVLEQTSGYFKTRTTMGCRYSETEIPESFREACGLYEVTNQNLSKLNIKCSLRIEDDKLRLDVKLNDIKLCFYLKVIDDSMAITQGFGRMAREMVQINKADDGIYLTCAGIMLRRKEDCKK